MRDVPAWSSSASRILNRDSFFLFCGVGAVGEHGGTGVPCGSPLTTATSFVGLTRGARVLDFRLLAVASSSSSSMSLLELSSSLLELSSKSLPELVASSVSLAASLAESLADSPTS